MALKSVLEIIVHLDRFKNIDLAQQGLYQLQLSCFYLQNSQKIFAIPISCISNRSVDIPQLMLNPHEIISGHIDEKLNSIKSKVFLIRYSEEKVKFNEVATFRMEMQANQNPQGLTVQLDLMFTEVPAKKPILESINQIALQKNFVILKSKQFVIANPLKGHHHYLPGLFDSDCFCNVDGIIHVVFYDYKITENEIENFVSVLFKDKKGKLKTFIGGGEIDRKYDEFITILAEVHEGIRLISESMKTNCGFSHVDIVEPLKLPLFSKDLEEIDGSFAERLISHDPYVIGEILLREVKLIAGCIYQAFMELRDMIESKPRKCCKYLKFLYEEKLLERYDDFIVKENNKI